MTVTTNPLEQLALAALQKGIDHLKSWYRDHQVTDKVVISHKRLSEMVKAARCSVPTKATKKQLEAIGIAHPLGEHEYRFGYFNPTETAENASIAIRHNAFHNSMGTLGSLMVLEMKGRIRYFIYGYVSGCFYPYLYELK